ncbi:MAG TPA: NAD(P)H-dependent oxidoreductase [Alphaproteobacteria bacterium]|nr:NAD(P)H-dependent oxidoreductase [Alphaproteobacteria bacterium]
MRALIVVAHPDPGSFNAQLASVAVQALESSGYQVDVSDLYALDFDAREGPWHYRARDRTDVFDVQAEQRSAARRATLPPDVQRELDKVMRSDLLILQYPTWWFSVPAILKGWVDRVLAYGTTYTSERRYDRGMLGGKRAMLSVTFGGAESTFAHNGRNGDVELLLWPMQMTLFYVGYQVLTPFTAFGIAGASTDSGKAALTERLERYKTLYRERLLTIDRVPALKFNGWADWDESGRLKPGVPGYSKFMRADP